MRSAHPSGMPRRTPLGSGLFWLLLAIVLASSVGALRLRISAEQEISGHRIARPPALAALPRCYKLTFASELVGKVPDLIRIESEAAGDRVPQDYWYVARARRAGMSGVAWWAQTHADSIDATVPGWPVGLRIRFPVTGGVGRARLSGDAVSDWGETGTVSAAPIPCPPAADSGAPAI